MALFYTMLGDPMNRSVPRLHAHGARLATLLGTASFLTMANVIADRDRAYAGEVEVAQAPEEIPENVLITGSLIRGTTAVGVPVVNLSPMDFAQTGALTTADLFKNFPAAIIMDGETGQIAAARVDRGEKVNLRGLDPTNATRGLLMVDGLRVPASGNDSRGSTVPAASWSCFTLFGTPTGRCAATMHKGARSQPSSTR